MIARDDEQAEAGGGAPLLLSPRRRLAVGFPNARLAALPPLSAAFRAKFRAKEAQFLERQD